MRQRAITRQEPGADPPPEREGGGDAEKRDQHRRQADLLHLVDRRFEADLEQQQQDAQLGQHLDRRIGADEVEGVDPDQPQVSEHDAGPELAEHRRLTQAHRQLAAGAGREQDDRQRQQDAGDNILRVGRVRRRRARDRRCQQQRYQDHR